VAGDFFGFRPNTLLADTFFAQPKGNEAYWRARLANQGGISKARPSLAGRLENAAVSTLRKAGVSDKRAARLGSKTFAAVNDFTPLGNATMAADAGQAFGGGHPLQGLGMSALAVLPGAAGKVGKGMFGRGVRAYHGGRAFEGDFDLNQAGSGLGYAEEPAVWFTPDQYEANRYAWTVDKSGTYEGKAVYPAVINDEGFERLPPMAYDPEEFARIIAEARKANKPGVIFRSVKEDDRLSTPVDQIAVFDPTRINSPFGR
jgi:hypothetical protein